MGMIIEDKVELTVAKMPKNMLLDELFLFEFLYFEYVCWKYLNVYQINDSKPNNLGVSTLKKPIVYCIGGVLFRFESGLCFNRIDFGDIFSFADQSDVSDLKKTKFSDKDLLENYNTNNTVSDTDVDNKSKESIYLSKHRNKVFKMEYTFNGFTQEELKEGGYRALDPERFIERLRNAIIYIQSEGIKMKDFQDVISGMYHSFIIRELPRDVDSYTFINSDLETRKRRLTPTDVFTIREDSQSNVDSRRRSDIAH
jgi:hypothetical protein